MSFGVSNETWLHFHLLWWFPRVHFACIYIYICIYSNKTHMPLIRAAPLHISLVWYALHDIHQNHPSWLRAIIVLTFTAFSTCHPNIDKISPFIPKPSIIQNSATTITIPDDNEIGVHCMLHLPSTLQLLSYPALICECDDINNIERFSAALNLIISCTINIKSFDDVQCEDEECSFIQHAFGHHFSL